MLAPSIGRCEDVALAPRPQVLLLHNRELLEGLVTEAGDHYDVSRAGGVIFVRRSEVAAICDSAEDCYLHQKVGIDSQRIQDRLSLAEWCLKNKLLEPAEQEIAACRLLDAGHPKIRLLEARLKLEQERRDQAQAESNEKVSAADKPVGERVGASSQLDRMMRNVPPGVLEHFTTTIQPILVNYCSKSGCHGPQSNGALRVERIHQSRVAGRYATQRNLQAALALVDRAKPDESKLLSVPVRAHGNMQLPVFTDREQTQYKNLIQWVHLVSGSRDYSTPASAERVAAAAGASAEGRRPALLEANTENPPTPLRSATNPPVKKGEGDWTESFPDQAKAGPVRVTSATEAVQNARSRSKPPLRPMPDATGSEAAPQDPFDPEIFHRRVSGP